MENTTYKVEVSKEFSVPVSKLYSAWTSPEELEKWWKPMNKNLSEVTNDLKEGGNIQYIFDDNSLVIEGNYLEVKEGQKLVYTWGWEFPEDEIKDANYKLTIEFSEKNGHSSIHVLQENFEDEEGVIPHKQGWEKSLEDLNNYLTSK